MEELTIPKGDYGQNLNFTCKDADDNAINLDGYTVTLKLWRPATPGTLVLNEECDIDVAASGTCHYTVQAEDFDDAVTYIGELELTKSGGSGHKESHIPIRLIVTESG